MFFSSKLKRSASILCLAAVMGLAACDPAAPVQQSYDFVQEVSDVAADQNVIYGRLENGLRYAVMQNDTPTNSGAIRLWFGTGSLNETDETQGLAHFLEHMAFNGSENMPEGEMTKTLERYGLAFGADTNAYTSFDETVYQLDLPDTSEEMFDVTLGIMRETASNLTLDPEAIDRERGIVISEKRRRNSPAWRAQMASFDFYLGDTLIPDRIPIGTEEDMESVQQTDFRAFYDGYYRPENAFLVIVADAEPQFVISQIEEHFADWTPRGEALANKNPGQVKAHGVETGYFSDPQVPTSVSISVMRPFKAEPDTRQARKEAVIGSLADAMFNRRLASLARQEDAVFHSGGAAQFPLFDVAEIASLTLNTSPENWDAALALGEQELRRAIEFGFSQDELDEQLANFRKSYEVAAQTAETRRTPSLAGQIVGAFSSERVFSTPQAELELFESFADEITPDEVWKAFKTRWKGYKEPLLYLSHSEGVENPSAAILAAWENSRGVKVTAPDVQEKADFAYTDFGPAGKIVSREHIEDLDVHLIRFDNNVRLNIKKTDFDKDSIRIQVQIGDGFLSLPPDNILVQEFADYAIGAGGLKAHSADDLQRILAGRAVGVRFGTSAETFVMSGSTVPEDLELQLQLMAAYTIAPGYRAEAKSRFDKQIESWYSQLRSTPGGVASIEVPRLVRSGDPRFGIPSKDEILSTGLSDVEAWLGPQLADGFIEISIVGDVDIDRAVEIVSKTFGALDKRSDARGTYDAQRVLKFPTPQAAPVTLYHDGEANRALLQIYWPAPDGTDIARSRQYSLMETIFSNRLIDVIREEEGATYSPSASRYMPDTYPGYGYIVVSLDLNPADVDRMVDVMTEIAGDFASGNISEDELDRARKPIMEQIEESLENNGYWGGVIAQAQSKPEDIENARTREAAYAAFTLEDMKVAARQVFSNEQPFVVKVLPKPDSKE